MTKQAPLAGMTFSCMGCGLPFKSLDYTVKGVPGYCKDCYHHLVSNEFVANTLANKPITHETVLEEAGRLIYGDRKEQYGNAERNFGDIGKLWAVVLGKRPSAEEVALCLLLLKVARAVNDTRMERPIKRDTIVDLAGYAGCIAKIQDGD